MRLLQAEEVLMSSRRRVPEQSGKAQRTPEPESSGEESLSPPTGVVFLGEEDKRILRKFNQHIVKKLGISGNRSFRI
jgi:hypothetical protein